MDRNQKIVRTSILGIGANLVLVVFKLIVGLAANSIAVILDAVNNLSDALSSLITIVGMRLAGRKPDKKHPFGHGRIEYLTGMLIAVLVLFAGLTSLKESVEQIIHPEDTSYTAVSLVVIAAAVLVKLLMGRYVKKVGEELNSQTLVASGSDASFDAVLSIATLVGALVNMLWGLQLEAWLGAVISGFIIKAGVEMLLEALSSITGERPDSELSEKLREAVCGYEEVRGAYDLVMHNYGPTNIIASVHIEVDDDMTAREIHRLTRQISSDIYQQFGIILTVGIYASGTGSDKSAAMRTQLAKLLREYPAVLQMHGFFVDEEKKRVMFDLIFDFSADAKAVCGEIHEKLKALWPEYQIDIVLDTDFSD